MSPPDGSGEGHFKTFAELRATVTENTKRIEAVERDVNQLADIVFGARRPKRAKRRNQKR